MQPGAGTWKHPGGRCQEGLGGSSENGLERFSVPRREQASMASLTFYCTLAQPYAPLVWAAPAGGASAVAASGELGQFCLGNET